MTVRTVIRRFGSRDGVVQAAVERFRSRLVEGPMRPLPPPGDVRAAVRLLMDYYEGDGAFLLRGLSQEPRFRFLQENFAGTRARHRAWTAAAFAPQLALPPRQHALKLTELAAVTWVTTWKFLRHDSGLDRDDTERALRSMIEAIADAR
jgi:AcrR family transcriptional regulator